MENFPIFRKKLFYAECSNSCDFGIKIFFCNFLKVENFPPKWKNFHFASLNSNLTNAKVQNPKTKFRQSGKFSTSAECSNSCDSGIKIFLEIFQSGKISTSSIWDAIWQTRRSRCRKKKFTKVENFPAKVEKFPPLQNVPIHVILE